MKTIALGLSLLLLDCAPKDESKPFDVAALTREMESDGWSYVETLGIPGDVLTAGRMKSKTGSLTAYWVVGGKRDQKSYEQNEHLYALVSLQKPSGDMFSVVYRRPRSSPPQ